MALLSAVVAVFPEYTIEDLLYRVPEPFLYQAENIYAQRIGLRIVRDGKKGASSDFVRRWELTTGRVWNDS